MEKFITDTLRETRRVLERYEKGILRWRMKDGSRVNIKDMSVGHIRNCLIGLNNRTVNAIDMDGWTKVFEIELQKRDPDEGFFAANRTIKIDQFKTAKFPWED